MNKYYSKINYVKYDNIYILYLSLGGVIVLLYH